MTRLGQFRLSNGYSLRLGAFYAAVFLVVGVQLPFWPVWLAGHGFDPQEIATVFAATIWAKVVATPAIGALADRTGQQRLVMVSLAAIAWIGYATLLPIIGFWPLLAVHGRGDGHRRVTELAQNGEFQVAVAFALATAPPIARDRDRTADDGVEPRHVHKGYLL